MIMFYEELARMTAGVTSAPTLRVLLALPSLLDFESWRRLDQRKLAAELGIAQPSVSRALADLLARRIVEKQGGGPLTEWRLSLEWGWRGNVETWHAARAARQGRKPPAKPRPAAVVAEGILWKHVRFRSGGRPQ